MIRVIVYYKKTDYGKNKFREYEVEAERTEPLKISDLQRTHTLIRSVEVEGQSDIYARMQFDNWTSEEKEEQHPADVEHKDMEIGDVYETQEGLFYECLRLGWREVF